MGKTKIEWTQRVWPITQGCDYVSPGCRGCYVVPMLWRLAHNPNIKVSAPLQGLVAKTAGALHFTGKIKLREDRMGDPFGWKDGGLVFVPSHGDIFHKSVPDSFLDQIWATMALNPDLTFQVLTKRPERAQAYLLDKSQARCDGRGEAIVALMKAHRPGQPIYCEGFGWPLPNVWLGISAEDQQRFAERWPYLRDTPAALRWLSYEPALGPLDPTDLVHGCMEDALAGVQYHDAPEGVRSASRKVPKLDWAVCGLESGNRARARDIELLRGFVRTFQRAGTPVFVKQLGRKPTDSGKRVVLESRKGGDPLEWPEDLRVRQFPA